jgi:HEPN domain-containing protein
MTPPPDPVRVENTREWLARAMEDLQTSAFPLTATEPFVRGALFHCQQSVEKAMKAFLTWHDAPFRKTHNLVELGDACSVIDDSLSGAVREVSVLSRHGVRFRYPGAPYEPEVEEAERALRIAQIFLRTLSGRFPAGVFPPI